MSIQQKDDFGFGEFTTPKAIQERVDAALREQVTSIKARIHAALAAATTTEGIEVALETEVPEQLQQPLITALDKSGWLGKITGTTLVLVRKFTRADALLSNG